MIRIFAPTVMLLLGLHVAHGGPLTFLQLNESADAGDNNTVGGSSGHFTSGILMQSNLTGPTFAQMISGLGFASTAGAVAPGQIVGFVFAEGKFGGGLGSQGNPQAGNGVSQVSGEWVDTLTIGGLPIGTAVTVRVTSKLHSVVGLFGTVPDAFDRAEAQASLRVLQGGSAFDLNVLDNLNSNVESMLSTSKDFVFTVGTSFIIEQSLTLNASALSSSVRPDVKAIADASNTSNAFIDVLTPGATLTSASGAQYASPAAVPEPATFVLLGCGLLAGGFFFRREHRKTT